VIKIERPGNGDFARAYDDRVRGQASHFVWTNRSKESICLDLKQQEGRAVLEKLVAKADVLVQNLAPGAAARMGMNFDALHPLHPKLIVCDISGYGDDPEHPGPYRDKKAYDLLIQSESGFLSVTGTSESPAKAGCSIADIAAGMYAYTNILAALLERTQTGVGKRIDISMLEAMSEWMSYPMYYAFDGAPPPERAGAAHATIYPYGPFTAGDGKEVMLGIQNEREWQEFCRKILCDERLITDVRFANNKARNENRDALRQLILTAFKPYTAQALCARLEAAQIANAQVNRMADLWAHPQLKARQRWTEIDTPQGRIPALLPVGVSDTQAARMGKVPAVGEHSRALLAELGYAETYIDQLCQQAVI
jgi:itaconate CoA-transferase